MNAQENSQHGHVFRPGLFRRRRAYWLDGHILRWRIGNETGQVPLGQVASMRLYLPVNGAALTARCELVEASGRRHRISDRYWFRLTSQERHRFGRHQRRTASFQSLCYTLARRVKLANPQAKFLMGPARSEWIATCMVAVLAIAVLIGGTGLMMAQGTLHYPAAAFMAIIVLYLPFLAPVLRAGGPKPFDPETLHNRNPPPDWVDW